jgi:hypothetical protein
MSEENNKPSVIDLDLSYLKDVASGSAEFMIEMIDIFLEQTPDYFDKLDTAVKEKDWKTVGDISHKIKPTLVFMGVDITKYDIGGIERKARELVDLEDIEPQFNSLKLMAADLFTRLEEIKKELQADC